MNAKDQKAPPGARLVIAPPAPDRPPMRANVFQFMCLVNTALGPMFPYVDEGAIVVSVSISTGGPKRRFGIFQHSNTVDEVYTIFGTNGTPMHTGLVMVGAPEHFVNPGFTNPEDPEQFVLFVIIQRQEEAGIDQNEKMVMICENCQTPLLTKAYSAKLSPELRAMIKDGGYPPFETILRASEIAEEFNADPQKRVCAECGHASGPFPVEHWGWTRYVEQCRSIEKAMAAYPGHR